MSTTSVRIKDDVYSRLELNAKGYESVSDTIARANMRLESWEALDMIDAQVKASIANDLSTGYGGKERILLMHYKEENVLASMEIINRLYPGYKISCDFKKNTCVIRVEEKDYL